MSGVILILAGIAGFAGVAAGAFGAHALRDRLPADLLAVYQTGALYHLVHAAALFGTALLARDPAAERLAGIAGAAFAVGIVVFSGSLYLMAVTGTRWLGAITPLGGVAFLIGWAALIWAGVKAV